MTLWVVAGLPSRAGAGEAVGPCGAGSAALTKTVTVVDRPDGSALATVRLETAADVRHALVVDCTWIDRNGDGAIGRDEDVSVHLRTVTFQGHGTKTATMLIAQAGASGARVCDRASLFAFGSYFHLIRLHSNVACDRTSPPVVPEAGRAAVLGGSALVVGGLMLWLLRRRRSALSTI
jgi:hypothetical protein